jgi:type 1 fimbria pilin
MTKRMKSNLLLSVASLLGLLLCMSGSEATSATAVPAKVASAPACDFQVHPKIVKVTPDTVKPGQRITIKGNKFGTKQCFQNVSFGSVGTSDFKYVNDSTLEATVPNLKPGLVPVNVLTAGGSSQFMVLVQK